ncbi:hypothetical protein GCM10027199_78860 [Amycolatopsis magusensis]
MPGGEILILGAGRGVAGRWPVVSTMEPDVTVVRAPLEAITEIAQNARLTMARLPTGETRIVGDESALEELDEGARMFVAAWRRRPIRKPHRVGEGLPWDAPGFEPPDRPAH